MAWVVSLDPVANAKGALTARIESHGGRVATRLGKEVSHVVWERSRSRRPSDKAADEQQLLELFHKLEKVGGERQRRQGAMPRRSAGAARCWQRRVLFGIPSSCAPAPLFLSSFLFLTQHLHKFSLHLSLPQPDRWTTRRWWCRRCGWRRASSRGAAWWSASTWCAGLLCDSTAEAGLYWLHIHWRMPCFT